MTREQALWVIREIAKTPMFGVIGMNHNRRGDNGWSVIGRDRWTGIRFYIHSTQEWLAKINAISARRPWHG